VTLHRNTQLVCASLAVGLLCGSATAAQTKPASPANQESAKSIAATAVGRDGTVCDAVLVPATGSSPAVVLATVDVTGRRFCNGLLRMSTSNPPVILQTIDTWNLEVVKDVLVDLDADGISELVVPTPISQYRGGPACMAVVPIVYKCTAAKCIDASDRFRGYYTSVLVRTEERLAKADAESAPCFRLQRDRLLKLSGR